MGTRGGKRPGAGRKKGVLMPETKAKIAARERALAAVAASEERTMSEIAALAYSNLGDFQHPDGTWKSLRELTPAQAACVQSVEVLKRNVEAGDGHTDTIYKLKLWDKPKALEMLAKHYGLLMEKVQHSGRLQISWGDGGDDGPDAEG